jgi:hypothetical protein
MRANIPEPGGKRALAFGLLDSGYSLSLTAELERELELEPEPEFGGAAAEAPSSSFFCFSRYFFLRSSPFLTMVGEMEAS